MKLFNLKVIFCFIAFNIKSYTSFVIVIPSYNNSKWAIRNLTSAVNQKLRSNGKSYPNFKIVYVNDNSRDNTLNQVKSYIKRQNLNNLVKIINNSVRVGALANIYKVVHNCKDDDVIIILDGDDWLAHNYVLDYLDKVYQDKNIWLTYGQFISSNGRRGWCKEIPKQVFLNNNIRTQKWVSSHLRTFYASLFKKIEKKDLVDSKGSFFTAASDVAIMFPILEMAGYNHYRFIKQVLYVYNRENIISDYRVNQNEQDKISATIRRKKSYKTLDKL